MTDLTDYLITLAGSRGSFDPKTTACDYKYYQLEMLSDRKKGNKLYFV